MPGTPSTAAATQRRRNRPRRAGRPAAATQNSRDLLLDAAARLMHARNSIDISLSELARHSGLNSALVKYYFGNKEGLLLALLKRDAARALSDLEHLLALDLPAEVKIKRHIAAVIDAFHTSPYMNRLLHSMLSDQPPNAASAKQIVAFFVKPYATLQRKLLTMGQASGRLRKVDPMCFYISVLGACDLIFNARFTLRAVFDTPRITDRVRRRYIDQVTELVLHGIAVRRT